MPPSSPGGPSIDSSGPEAAPANRSAWREKARESTIPAIFGQRGSASSKSAALQSLWVNRLREKTASTGSTVFTFTWKARTTPSQRRIYALRASARSTSGNDSGLWPTPTGQDNEQVRGEKAAQGNKRGTTLGGAARAASWATPTSHDAKGTDRKRYTEDGIGEDRSQALLDQAQLTSWATPQARDYKDTPGMATDREDGRGRLDTTARQAHLTHWPTPTREDAESTGVRPVTEKRSSPSHTLNSAAETSGWPTPNVPNGGRVNDTISTTGKTVSGHKRQVDLQHVAKHAHWPTPTAVELGNSIESYEAMKANMTSGKRSAITHLSVMAQASGTPSSGSRAGTGKPGQLNPELPRWLMGYPVVWLFAVPFTVVKSSPSSSITTRARRRSKASATPSSPNSEPSS